MSVFTIFSSGEKCEKCKKKLVELGKVDYYNGRYYFCKNQNCKEHKIIVKISNNQRHKLQNRIVKKLHPDTYLTSSDTGLLSIEKFN